MRTCIEGKPGGQRNPKPCQAHFEVRCLVVQSTNHDLPVLYTVHNSL